MAQMVKKLTAKQEIQVPSLDQEDSLEKEMVTHSSISSILVWEIPWTEEPGELATVHYSPWGRGVGHE